MSIRGKRELIKLLGDFGWLDGAVVESLELTNRTHEPRKAEIVLRAFYEGNDFDQGWKFIRIIAVDHVMLGWIELSRNSNLVINYPAEILVLDNCLVIDFDPLHKSQFANGVALSCFFIGARELTLSLLDSVP
jgi:hypothetical protein